MSNNDDAAAALEPVDDGAGIDLDLVQGMRTRI